MSKDIESLIKNLSMTRRPGPDNYIRWILLKIKEALTTILIKLVQKIEEEGILPNSFYMASIVLIPKPDKNTTRKNKTTKPKNHRPISSLNIDEKFSLNISKPNSNRNKSTIHYDQAGLILVIQGWFNTHKSIKKT